MTWRILFIICLAGCFALGATVRATPPHPSSRADLVRVVTAPIPGRNLYVLTDQLKLRPPRPIPHVVHTVSPNYPVGHTDNFNVFSDDANRNFVMRATVRAKTAHLYIYVQDGLKVNEAALLKAAHTFETKTYVTDRALFGSEWRPGVDGDLHITCLLGDLRSSTAAGFFSAEDEYPKIVNRYSNQREIVYMNSNDLLPGEGSFDLTLAHEFQHMIHWHMHPHDNGWVNEGMSTLAENLNGYSTAGETESFISIPSTQLNSWAESGDQTISHYGAAYLFLAYLYDRYGKAFVRTMLADSRYTDFELVNDVLQKLHVKKTSDALLADWVVANYIADSSVLKGRYGYSQLPRHVNIDHSVTVPFSVKDTSPPYAARYTVIDTSQQHMPFHLHVTAPPTIRLVGVKRPAPFWWSNRGDMSDTRMERSFDLRGVKRATLTFGAWYDIEKDYDYAYIEASTDGGTTWTPLPSADTTKRNPNGASYGPAFTGSSKGWKTEKVNLSQYAGKQIKVRFQYLTDDVYNGQGLLVKDMAIPEIGFHDSYGGWHRNGFVPVHVNSLPSNWMIQVISYGSTGIAVHKLRLNSAGTVSLAVDPGKSGLKKLVVVSYMAVPKTTVQLPLTLSASNG